jgi:hypothetical protein
MELEIIVKGGDNISYDKVINNINIKQVSTINNYINLIEKNK